MGFRHSVLLGLGLSLMTSAATTAQDSPCLNGYRMLVPDGTELSKDIVAGGWLYGWYGFRIKPDRSYSFVVAPYLRQASANGPAKWVAGPPVIGPCGEGGPIPFTETSHAEPETIDPSNTEGAERLSFKSSWATEVFVKVGQVSGTDQNDFLIRVEETTLFNPLFSTFGDFEGYYHLQNTTGQDVSVTLKLISDSGVTVANATFTVAANRSLLRYTGAYDLNVPDNTIGQAIITHDGAPGAIQVDGFMSSALTTAVLPLKIVSARQQR